MNISSGLGDAPRNFLRGFGAWQMDIAVRREFPIHERLKVQFRAEAFNIFNHPNFGFINPNCGGAPGTLVAQTHNLGRPPPPLEFVGCFEPAVSNGRCAVNAVCAQVRLLTSIS